LQRLQPGAVSIDFVLITEVLEFTWGRVGLRDSRNV